MHVVVGVVMDVTVCLRLPNIELDSLGDVNARGGRTSAWQRRAFETRAMRTNAPPRDVDILFVMVFLLLQQSKVMRRWDLKVRRSCAI